MCNCNTGSAPDRSLTLTAMITSNGAIVMRESGRDHLVGRVMDGSAVFTDAKALGAWFEAWFQANVPAEKP